VYATLIIGIVRPGSRDFWEKTTCSWAYPNEPPRFGGEFVGGLSRHPVDKAICFQDVELRIGGRIFNLTLVIYDLEP
jgi:hypothetical protein